MHRRKFVNAALGLATVLGFTAGGHYAASGLIHFQQMQQLEDIGRVALRRAEAAVEYGAAALDELAAQGSASCEPGGLQAVRFHLYRRGALKDIRMTDANGAVLCSAYPETLEFDQGWASRDAMLPTAVPALRLFRVDQFFGSALGIFRDVPALPAAGGKAGGLASILGLSGASFDIMPAEIRSHSSIALELSDGRSIAQTGSEPDADGSEAITVALASDHLPLRASLKVERAALAHWDQEAYQPILGLSAALGIVFAFLLLRAVNRPPDPIRELDRAIAGGEFKPFLQPIFALDGGAITGAEILARRVLPDGTVVPPSRFVELAERSGRIVPITWALLSEALQALKPVFRRDAAFRLSVNITPYHFVAAGFAEELERTVSAAGIPASQITLELTEREAFEDFAQAAGVVAKLRAKGYRIALDDVGTGHSGLSQIQSLRADVLKIDKFFVDGIGRDPSATMMVEMLVRLAAEMKMGIVAEGIEESAQASALLACGVASGQGYLVSPPVPAVKFLQMIDERAMRDALKDEAQDEPRAA